MVHLLLAAPGINVNQANKNGETPIDVAKADEIKHMLRAAGGKSGKELPKGMPLYVKLLIGALILILLGCGWYGIPHLL